MAGAKLAAWLAGGDHGGRQGAEIVRRPLLADMAERLLLVVEHLDRDDVVAVEQRLHEHRHAVGRTHGVEHADRLANDQRLAGAGADADIADAARRRARNRR